MATDPFELFDQWFAQARASEPSDPEAAALATADVEGRPSVRIVLLKGYGRDGFVFYESSPTGCTRGYIPAPLRGGHIYGRMVAIVGGNPEFR